MEKVTKVNTYHIFLSILTKMLLTISLASALDPPTHLEVPSWPPGTYRTQNSVTVRWFGPVSANTYVITVYL